MEEIWLAKYTDYMYPEDNEIFGAYATEQGANNRLAEELKLAQARNPNYPELHTKTAWRYSIEQICFINQ